MNTNPKTEYIGDSKVIERLFQRDESGLREAESRYNDDFTALIEDVEDARRLAREMLQYCDSLVQEI